MHLFYRFATGNDNNFTEGKIFIALACLRHSAAACADKKKPPVWEGGVLRVFGPGGKPC